MEQYSPMVRLELVKHSPWRGTEQCLNSRESSQTHLLTSLVTLQSEYKMKSSSGQYVDLFKYNISNTRISSTICRSSKYHLF